MRAASHSASFGSIANVRTRLKLSCMWQAAAQILFLSMCRAPPCGRLTAARIWTASITSPTSGTATPRCACLLNVASLAADRPAMRGSHGVAGSFVLCISMRAMLTRGSVKAGRMPLPSTSAGRHGGGAADVPAEHQFALLARELLVARGGADGHHARPPQHYVRLPFPIAMHTGYKVFEMAQYCCSCCCYQVLAWRATSWCW